MRILYTLRARADLEQIYDYLEKRAPAAAHSVIATIERQADYPLMG